MGLATKRIDIVRTNFADLCDLLNVEDDRYYLQKFMSPEAVQDCIQGGYTNMERVHLLCEKMIQEITTGSTKMYEGLCEHFLMRSEAYKSMFQRFTSIHPTHIGKSSSEAHSEIFLLQKTVKRLSEAMLNWHQSRDLADVRSSAGSTSAMKVESEVNQLLKNLQEMIKYHITSPKTSLLLNPYSKNVEPQSKYLALGNGHPIANNQYSEIYLWQRKSDGIIFIMQRYYSESLSIAWRDAKLRETTYLIENIMSQPHPYILHFVDCFVDRTDKLCVIMEHCNMEKLNWLIEKRKDDWFSEEEMVNWVAQICFAEKHIQNLEEQLQIGIIFDIKDIFLKWASRNNREVKVRIHPLPLCKDISRVTTMRKSNIFSIFSQLLPKLFKDSDIFSEAFRRFAGDFHNQKFSSLNELMESSILKRTLETVTSSALRTVTPRSRFIYIATIGVGSFGRVEKMWDREKKKLCAVKNIHGFMIQEETLEIEVMKQCRHENIVKLVDSFNAEHGHLWIVMEYCDGGNLHDRIQAQGGGAFSPAQVSFFFIQVVKALQYLHEKTTYFHGDIKPQNILLFTSENRSESLVKLGDFGTAQLLSPNQSVMSTFRRIGTPRYMAPEIFEFKPCGKSADLWSLGCLLYEMVALSPAFGFKDEDVLIERIKRAEPLPMPSHIPFSISERFSSLIQGLLCADPGRRLTLRKVYETLCTCYHGKNEDVKPCNSKNNISAFVRYAENRSQWFDGHAPLLEIDPGTYPMIPWQASTASSVNHMAKLALLKKSKSSHLILWLRIRQHDKDLIVDISGQANGVYFNRIALTLFFRAHDNGEEAFTFHEIPKEANVICQSVWTEALRFHNISEIPAYMQASLGSECRVSRSSSVTIPYTILNADIDGIYPTIDCHSRETDRQIWWRMCSRSSLEYSKLQLPSLSVTYLEQCYSLSLVLARNENDLWMYLKSHRLCPKFVLLQLHCQIILTNMDGEENVIENKQFVEVAQIAQQSSSRVICIESVFTSPLHPLVPPRVNISITLAKEELLFWWRGIPPISLSVKENESYFRVVFDSEELQPDFSRWIGKTNSWLWLPALLLGVREESLAMVVGLKKDRKSTFMSVGFHPQMPSETPPIRAKIDFKLSVIWNNKEKKPLFHAKQSLVIGYKCQEIALQLQRNILLIDDIERGNVAAFTSPRSRILIYYRGDYKPAN